MTSGINVKISGHCYNIVQRMVETHTSFLSFICHFFMLALTFCVDLIFIPIPTRSQLNVSGLDINKLNTFDSS